MANPQNLAKRSRDNSQFNDEDGLVKEVLLTRRTTKVVRGGKKTRVAALVVVGDRKGHVGVSMGKALDARTAVDKAIKKAKKNMITVPLTKGTIPHDVVAKFGSSKILLKPAKKGTGMIASNVVRTVLEIAGVKDIVSKMYGTSNKITNAYCIMGAVKQLKSPRARYVKTEENEAEKVPAEAPKKNSKTEGKVI